MGDSDLVATFHPTDNIEDPKILEDTCCTPNNELGPSGTLEPLNDTCETEVVIVVGNKNVIPVHNTPTDCTTKYTGVHVVATNGADVTAPMVGTGENDVYT